MAFDLEAVMPSEFIVPSLQIQSEYRLNELESEQARMEQLLRLEEDRIRSIEAMEHEQRLRKAFVDRHRKRNEERFGIGKAVLLFQSRSGLMPGKLRLQWTGPYWIVKADNGTYQLGTVVAMTPHVEDEGTKVVRRKQALASNSMVEASRSGNE
jgi:hypothetical protein